MPNLSQKAFSRRDLFRGLRDKDSHDKSAALTQQETVERVIPRPPYAVDESLFTRLCTGCGQCQQACPQQIITLLDERATIDVSYTPCTFCTQCQQSCPTLALSGLVKDTGLRATISDTCINQDSYCDSCQQSCASHAIIWQENQKPAVNLAACNGCGVCQSDCFIDAIQFRPHSTL